MLKNKKKFKKRSKKRKKVEGEIKSFSDKN